MNDVMKGMFIVLIIIYLLSPVDLCPGPVDDLIVLLVGITALKNKNMIEGE